MHSSKKSLLYDKQGGGALQSDLRSPQIHAQLRPRMRQCTGWPGCWKRGEDPLYVARRLIRFASEDVGLADPRALELVVARLPGLPLHWNAGVQPKPDSGGGVPVFGPQVQFVGCGLPVCQTGRLDPVSGAGAFGDPQRSHLPPVDERASLRGRLPVRPTTPKTNSPICNACRILWWVGSITALQNKGWRGGLRHGWPRSRSGKSAMEGNEGKGNFPCGALRIFIIPSKNPPRKPR